MAEQYDRKKRELGVLDFNDLLIHARDLLVGPERGEMRKRLAGQIRLLLVDEFQDTDPLQVELVKALCDNDYLRGKLFFVGDYKQSIYRFRGADPGVFRSLREEIPSEGRLPLSLNFRSQPAILDFVNALFCGGVGARLRAACATSAAGEPPAGGGVFVGQRFDWALKCRSSQSRPIRVRHAALPSPLPTMMAAAANGSGGARPIGSRGASADARLGRKDRLGRRGGESGKAGGPRGQAGRLRPAVPRPDER